jgi:hypothetical protein
MARKKCKPCEATRKLFPQLVRKRLEMLERRMVERKERNRKEVAR